ncbi:MAG: HypC/HybG/HupF family hydrogenase formation chaperone [Nitrospirae bacterium]|nr:HypC/HybG/HupF family hydrogenase formation chaperone [Nitrospirota bacterium]MCL5422700.1 HypC/HybG/HupF family hydrogenase formation chaperone [Nitrospirota bacterium]
MCLAVPSEIVSINDLMATIDVNGARRDISLMLLPEEAQVGDFVIVHAGFAIQKIDREAGQEALRLIKELVESEEFKAEYME